MTRPVHYEVWRKVWNRAIDVRSSRVRLPYWPQNEQLLRVLIEDRVCDMLWIHLRRSR